MSKLTDTGRAETSLERTGPQAPSGGRVAIVTGAGRGLGRAMTLGLTHAGIRVVATAAREHAEIEAVEAEAGEGMVVPILADVTREADTQRVVATALERFGRLDVAVNAAGMLRLTPFEEIGKAEWDQVMDANAGSVFLVCRECCAPMRRQRSGRIINFSSISGQTGGILSGAHYAAGKAAVISITRSVAKLLAPYGVRCNAIAPAGVDTEMLRSSPNIASGLEVIAPEDIGTPAEIASAILFLASDEARFVTGASLLVDGGRLARL